METRLTSKGILILDIPVIHDGYVRLLEKHAGIGDISTIYLVGRDLLKSLETPQEIRANDPVVTKKMLEGLKLPFKVEILTTEMMDSLPKQRIYTARDEVSRRLHEKYFPEAKVNEETVFLRWDEGNVTSTQKAFLSEETDDPFHISMMERVRKLADRSSDWWRQVAAIVVRDGKVLVEGYSHAYPTEHNPYIDGNPRDFIKAGTIGFLGKTVHAEQTAIAKAAKAGIKLDGADLYLNSFPCPSCACSMALAGVKRCFATGGNAYLDTAETLKQLGIETIFVKEK